jgi:hypothetical protein
MAGLSFLGGSLSLRIGHRVPLVHTIAWRCRPNGILVRSERRSNRLPMSTLSLRQDRHTYAGKLDVTASYRPPLSIGPITELPEPRSCSLHPVSLGPSCGAPPQRTSTWLGSWE